MRKGEVKMDKIDERTATELFELIYLMPRKDISKIPSEFLEFLHKKKSNNWYTINNSDEIKINNLSKETINYLSYIYLNYILEENDKDVYKNILEENEKNYQENISKEYDISSKLKGKHIKNENIKDLTVKKNNFFKNMIEKIKSLFKRLQ